MYPLASWTSYPFCPFSWFKSRFLWIRCSHPRAYHFENSIYSLIYSISTTHNKPSCDLSITLLFAARHYILICWAHFVTFLPFHRVAQWMAAYTAPQSERRGSSLVTSSNYRSSPCFLNYISRSVYTYEPAISPNLSFHRYFPMYLICPVSILQEIIWFEPCRHLLLGIFFKAPIGTVISLTLEPRKSEHLLKDLEGTTAHDIAKDHGHVGVRLFLRSPYIST